MKSVIRNGELIGIVKDDSIDDFVLKDFDSKFPEESNREELYYLESDDTYSFVMADEFGVDTLIAYYEIKGGEN